MTTESFPSTVGASAGEGPLESGLRVVADAEGALSEGARA